MGGWWDAWDDPEPGNHSLPSRLHGALSPIAPRPSCQASRSLVSRPCEGAYPGSRAAGQSARVQSHLANDLRNLRAGMGPSVSGEPEGADVLARPSSSMDELNQGLVALHAAVVEELQAMQPPPCSTHVVGPF
jgi:hypothetical protein